MRGAPSSEHCSYVVDFWEFQDVDRRNAAQVPVAHRSGNTFHNCCNHMALRQVRLMLRTLGWPNSICCQSSGWRVELLVSINISESC